MRALRYAPQVLLNVGPRECNAYEFQQTRGIRLFEIFSDEKREERKRKLKEDMQRGYFDDFRNFRDTQGKVFLSPERMIPSSAAPLFPSIRPLLPDGSVTSFPFAGAAAPLSTLVCVAFRAGAQGMLEQWAHHFANAHKDDSRAALVELALIESAVMKIWPFRHMLISASSQKKSANKTQYLYLFDNVESLCAPLHMANRLTGYAYLLDQAGRVRWQGSGSPDEREVTTLLECSSRLLLHDVD